MGIRRILGIETHEDRLAAYEKLSEDLALVNAHGKELAHQFSIQKSIINELDAQVPEEERAEVLAKHAKFMKAHAKNVADTTNERNRILKEMDSLEEYDAEIKKTSQLRKAVEGFAAGRLSRSQYFDIRKAITGEPTRYADMIAVRRCDNKILILHRCDDDMIPTGTVCIPGGHVDPGENFEEAALRELKEETNLDPVKDGGIRLLGEYKSDSAHIQYFAVVVDELQPVTLDASEHCFAEWIDTCEIPLKPFIFDQGEKVLKVMMDGGLWNLNTLKPILYAYQNGKMTYECFKEVWQKQVEKSIGTIAATPLMPESMDGEAKELVVPVRDPEKGMLTIFKSIASVEEVTLNDKVTIKMDKPLTVEDVLYKEDPSKGHLVECVIRYIGSEEDLMMILNEYRHGLLSGKAKIRTAHEEFLTANENGVNYVGEPILLKS